MHINVLIVEDCVEFANTLKNMLINDYNAQVSWVSSMGMLEAVVRKVRPTLVLYDLMLHNQLAIEFIPRLKQLGSAVIVISGLSNKTIVDKAYALGADTFVSKPTTIDYLQKVLGEHLRPRESRTVVFRDFQNSYIVSHELPEYVLEWLDTFKSNKLKGYMFTDRDRLVLGILYQYKRVPKRFLKSRLGISDGNLRVLLSRLRRKLRRSGSCYSIWADYYGNLILTRRVSQSV